MLVWHYNYICPVHQMWTVWSPGRLSCPTAEQWSYRCAENHDSWNMIKAITTIILWVWKGKEHHWNSRFCNCKFGKLCKNRWNSRLCDCAFKRNFTMVWKLKPYYSPAQSFMNKIVKTTLQWCALPSVRHVVKFVHFWELVSWDVGRYKVCRRALNILDSVSVTYKKKTIKFSKVRRTKISNSLDLHWLQVEIVDGILCSIHFYWIKYISK